MQSSVFTQFFLPSVLVIIMFGMGLSLTKADFSRLLITPKPVIVGIFGQIVLLPLTAFCLALIFKAPPEIAIGLLILAACPGGTSSNLISHVAKANLALSVSMTAITTIICVLTTPLLIKVSIGYFSQEQGNEFSLIATSLGLLTISMVPVILGMLAKVYLPRFAQFAESKFRSLSTVFMVLLIAIICYQERELIIDAFPDVFLFAIALNVGATAIGLAVASLAKLSSKDSVTLGIEIGTQNATMGILIAVSFIQMPAYSVVPAIYGVTMYFVMFFFVLLKRKHLFQSHNS